MTTDHNSDGLPSSRVKPGSIDHVLVSHIFGAVQLGAKFGGEPHERYAEMAAMAIVDDLLAHGYWITKREGTR